MEALGVVATLAASPPVQALDASVDFGVQAYRLREFSADGARLVREWGTAPRVDLRVDHPLTQGLAIYAQVGGWATRADYSGQSQGGVPVASHTDTTSLTLQTSLGWRPTDTGFDVEVGMEVERLRRRIRGTADYGGLDERLLQPRWLLRGGWRSPKTTLIAGAVWGPRSALEVRFDNQLFDTAKTRSGRSAGLTFQAWRALGPAWRIGAKLDVLEVGSGLSSPLRRGGQTVGTVTQPRWRREQMAVVLERSL